MARFYPPSARVLIAAVLLVALPLSGCTQAGTIDTSERSVEVTTTIREPEGEGMATIYLAGGCFWGVEKYMSLINGVTDAESGYANGTIESPTYEDVTTGNSGYTETVRVEYDPEVAPLSFLLDLFYKAIDPTTVNRQGNDVGSNYRSGVYYTDPADRAIIEASLAKLQKSYDDPIAVEVKPIKSYTPAEEYHQDYLEKNPGGYCHITPGLFDSAAKARPE